MSLMIDGKQELVADLVDEMIARVRPEDPEISAMKRQILQLKLENEKLKLENEKARLETEKLELLARGHKARSQIPRNDRALRNGNPPQRVNGEQRA